MQPAKIRMDKDSHTMSDSYYNRQGFWWGQIEGISSSTIPGVR